MRWFPRCFGEYSSDNEDTGQSTKNDQELNETGIEINRTSEAEPFPFRDASSLGTLPVVTPRAVYGGGGFVEDLGYDLPQAKETIFYLKKYKWITRQTRAIFVETVFFEPASNIFAIARFTFERMATGKIFTFIRVEPLSFYGSDNPTHANLIIYSHVFLVVLVVINIFGEVREARRQRWRYFKDPWIYMDGILNITAIAVVVVLLFKAEYTRQIIDKIKRNPFGRMSFDFVALWTDIESVLLALVVFLATMKLLRIVKFNEHVSILAWTIRFSRGPLVSYSIIFLVQVLAFALLGNLLFTNDNYMYSTIPRTLVNCFEMILGKGVDFDELKGSHEISGPLYILSYNAVITILVMNFFIAILCDSFAEAQEKNLEGNEDTEITEHMVDCVKDSLREISENLRVLVKGQKKENSGITYNENWERDYFLYWRSNIW